MGKKKSRGGSSPALPAGLGAFANFEVSDDGGGSDTLNVAFEWHGTPLVPDGTARVWMSADGQGFLPYDVLPLVTTGTVLCPLATAALGLGSNFQVYLVARDSRGELLATSPTDNISY